MTGKHTETPIGRELIERLTEIAYRDTAQSVTVRAADLRAAVRAVNAHEGLLSLLQRIQTHIAVGCKPERGYGTAHTELAIEIDAALSAD